MSQSQVCETIGRLRSAINQSRADAVASGDDRLPVALVPTMGALHDGHLALVHRAQQIAHTVVVSIFVNPLQFDDPGDLTRYPRTLETDVALLEGTGASLVFAPTAAEMYPVGASPTRVVPGAVGALYEGVSRPGHFDGMLTVVNKLVNISGCDVAVFGQKDAQQAFLVSQMVRDLNLPVRLEVVPTVRESDGLALSSRNRFLTASQRTAALTLSRALAAAAEAAHVAGSTALSVTAAARAVLDAEPLVKLDYLVLAHPNTFLPVDDDYRGPAIMLIAALVGTTRLIDNAHIQLG